MGLDPSIDLLSRWGLPQSAEGLRRFCEATLEAAGEAVAVFKPQAGFFEAFGPEGMAELAGAVAGAKARGALALIDAKRGDVGTTMEGYARAMLGPESGFGGDAVTAAPWMGFAALGPLLARAREVGGAVFVVVRSSNPEGAGPQNARHADGRTAAEAIADEITAFNAAAAASVGPACAVVGATLAPADVSAILSRLPRSLVLAPGVGAQGASFADVAMRFGAAAGRTLPSVSRAILEEGPDVGRLRTAILRARDEAFAMANAH